ncbi:hypothetical protein B5E56_09710 [Flavonifractor sp. An112]|uniref:DUF4391 domain-containing protein n=1 Tax=Flavonifractor sp. An112 TaxID=1965544 RepID=UPI000B367E13|nr:DUF4391 domain-containing protein [Flavonifractor sp. An112]OUQ59021.1 hypothetical protein B5E56_09710 [Flavonifractor sp. An112]
MLDFPKSTVFGRRFPKQKFYENLDVSADVKRLFVEQVKLITWANKLSHETMNIAPGQMVCEVEVFRLTLLGQELDERVLSLMDRQIPYHILFLLERPDGSVRFHVTYKEASQSGSNAFQLRQSYHTEWSKPEDLSLNLTALDMDALYESIVRQIAGDAIDAPQGESLKEAVEQAQHREKLEKQIAQLKAKMKKEKQLGRQMELRRDLLALIKAFESKD